METTWKNIYSLITKIIDVGIGKSKRTYGRDLIDLPPDKLILYGTKFPYHDGTMELTLTTPPAHPIFEWEAEITIKLPGKVEHYLLRPDQTIVETYGKSVYDVSLEKAQRLEENLRSLKHEA